MELKHFIRSEHLPVIAPWLESRALGVPAIETIPAIGFIVYMEGVPTASAHLRRVEGGFGQLDNLVTNPDQPPQLRSRAIDAIVFKIIQLAQTIGIKSIIAFSLDENTLKRSAKHGFEKLPHTLIAVPLSQQKD